MKKYLIGAVIITAPILTAITIIACTKAQIQTVKCDLEDGLEGTISYGIEKLANCSQPTAVRASVNGWVDSAGVCPTDAKMLKAIDANGICGVIVGALTSAAGSDLTQALNSKFPAWQCDPTANLQLLAGIAATGCNAVFPVAIVVAKPAPSGTSVVPLKH